MKFYRRTLLKGASGLLLSRPALAWFPRGHASSPAFTINYANDSSNSWNSAPAAYTTILNKVIADLCSWIANPVTLNIQVGYGTVAGSALGGSALGSSLTSYVGV